MIVPSAWFSLQTFDGHQPCTFTTAEPRISPITALSAPFVRRFGWSLFSVIPRGSLKIPLGMDQGNDGNVFFLSESCKRS
jgi:hypothetical protein